MQNPIDEVLKRLSHIRKCGDGWTARCPCPGHQDANPSLSVHIGEDGRVLLCCHRGCSVEDIVAALGLTLANLFPQSNIGPQSLTVEDLAQDKGLSAEYLLSLGVRETNSGIVRIEYRLEDGSLAPRQRIRTALRAGDGSKWAKGNGKVVPYGLWKLREAREKHFLIVVEGESDCWTLWHYELPALGIPGANMTKTLDIAYLQGIDTVYVVQEPDEGGEIFVRKIRNTLRSTDWAGVLYIVELPDGIKDPNALHTIHPDCFVKEFQAALTLARPAEVMDPDAKKNSLLEEGPDIVGPGLVQKLADEITGALRFARDGGGRLYVFANGVYTPGGEQFVVRRVKQLVIAHEIQARWSTHLAKEVVQWIRADAPVLCEMPPSDRINLSNGILYLDSLELKPHDPLFLSPIQVPIVYDPGATCPAIEQFFADVFPEDCRDLPWQILGDLLTPDRSIQKVILLTGEGGNGKGVFLALAMNFVGRQNVSHLSIQKLETDRFAVAGIYGKLANICGDLSSEQLMGTSVFKQITGNDTMTGEYKFHDAFSFTPYCRLLFATNHVVQSKDASKAFYDRWLIVPFNRVFRGARNELPRRVLDATLATPTELSGAFNRAIAALMKLRVGGTFTESKSMRMAFSQLQAVTDPLAVWLDRHTISDPRAMIIQDELHSAYNDACERSRRPPLTKQAFGRALKKLRPGIQGAQRTVRGGVPRVYLGIGLKAPNGSSDSRDSRDSSLPVPTTNRGDVTPGEPSGNPTTGGTREQDKADRVNRVNAVNGKCIRPCYLCRGTRFWRKQSGELICGLCHPPIQDWTVEWVEAGNSCDEREII